ncbi:unnamed protein product [Rhizophagus irregularis]|nr:unnamed protein product [Rhizophagus irregularis]
MDETPKNLWITNADTSKYQFHITIPTIDSTIESENVDERVVYIGDLEKRKQALRDDKYALKSLNNSSDICSDFLNEIKSHLQIHLVDIVQCFGITQDPNNKESKIDDLQQIARGLLDIHNAEKVHKDFHSDIEDSEDSENSNYSEDDEDGEDSDDVKDGEDTIENNEYGEDGEDIEDNEDSEDGEDGEDIKDNKDSEDNEDENSKNVNSSDLSSFQFSSDTSYTAQSTSANPISECLDVQLSELELNEICQDGEDNIE